MPKVVKFFMGTTKGSTDQEVDPKQLSLWEETLTKEYGNFLRQTVDSVWLSEYSGMKYDAAYCYTVSTSENIDFDELSIFRDIWAKRLEQYMISHLIQDADIANF